MEELVISEAAQKCISALAELIKQENRIAGEVRDLVEEHKRLWQKIQEELGSDVMLLEYAALTDTEIAFFDPNKAYLVGRLAKLDGVAKEAAYVMHIEDIKKEEEYNETRVALNSLFERILQLLHTEIRKDDMYRLDVLHNMIYGAIKRKLYIFFNLGFDCCIVEPEEIGLVNRL